MFGDNLKDLLLAAPAGPKTVLGLDPGIRTGCKIAVVDATGKLVATDTIYPHEPRRQWDQSVQTIKQRAPSTTWADRDRQWHRQPRNRQAGRRSDQGCRQPEAAEGRGQRGGRLGVLGLRVRGQGVPGAGRVAAWRGIDRSSPADPLAELVKIEPKAIGVGQYQHDVDQYRLARALDARVEDCVNAVGVYVNTASAALLSRVSGLSATVAENIVRHRDDNGPFKRRRTC